MNSEFDDLSTEGAKWFYELVLRYATQDAMGVSTLREFACIDRKIDPEVCRAVWQWMEIDDFDSPLSFASCARNLGLDPASLRSKMKKRWLVLRDTPEHQKLYGKLFVSPIKTREEAENLFNAAEEPITGDTSSTQQFALAL